MPPEVRRDYWRPSPLWISRTGEQLSVRSLTKIVTKVMAGARDRNRLVPWKIVRDAVRLAARLGAHGGGPACSWHAGSALASGQPVKSGSLPIVAVQP